MIQKWVNKVALKVIFLGVIITILGLVACSNVEETAVSNTTQTAALCENKTIEDTAEDLARCLPHIPSAKEQLQKWQRIESNGPWGSVTSIDLLPGHGIELVITYHENLDEVTWSPQGMIAILQKQDDQWHVAFESPPPTSAKTAQPDTLEGNWQFQVIGRSDLTGDGFDDLLIEQSYSNGLRAGPSHTKLFTASKNEATPLNIINLQDSVSSPVQYSIEDGTVHTDFGAIDQWHKYDPNSEAFSLVREEVDVEKAQLSLQTPDGAQWLTFHESTNLYRIENGNLSRIDHPVHSSLLQYLDDGHVYIGSGGRLQRVEDDVLVNVLATYAPLDTNFIGKPVHLALAEDGSIWVAALFKLLHLSKEESTMYNINARKVIVTSDGSVWADAWDGKSETVDTCCYMHIDENVIKRYWFDGELPVTAKIEKEIRAMRSED